MGDRSERVHAHRCLGGCRPWCARGGLLERGWVWGAMALRLMTFRTAEPDENRSGSVEKAEGDIELAVDLVTVVDHLGAQPAGLAALQFHFMSGT